MIFSGVRRNAGRVPDRYTPGKNVCRRGKGWSLPNGDACGGRRRWADRQPEISCLVDPALFLLSRSPTNRRHSHRLGELSTSIYKVRVYGLTDSKSLIYECLAYRTIVLDEYPSMRRRERESERFSARTAHAESTGEKERKRRPDAQNRAGARLRGNLTHFPAHAGCDAKIPADHRRMSPDDWKSSES